MEKEMLNVKDLMDICGQGRDSCYALMNSNSFHTVKVGRQTLVHKEIFYKWLKGEKSSRRY